MFADPVTVNRSCTHFVQQVSATPIIIDPIAVADAPCKRVLSARSHEASATAIGSMIRGVPDTCCTKWVQDPLIAT